MWERPHDTWWEGRICPAVPEIPHHVGVQSQQSNAAAEIMLRRGQPGSRIDLMIDRDQQGWPGLQSGAPGTVMTSREDLTSTAGGRSHGHGERSCSTVSFYPERIVPRGKINVTFNTVRRDASAAKLQNV